MGRKSVIIAISMQANEVLGRLQVKVNKDFLGGRITKRDLASWVIANGETLLSDRSIADIQKTDPPPKIGQTERVGFVIQSQPYFWRTRTNEEEGIHQGIQGWRGPHGGGREDGTISCG